MTDQFNFDNPIIPGSIWDKNADYKIPVVSPVGNGPKGDKGDPAYFDDLTDQQLSKIYQEASFVGNKSEDAVITTTATETELTIPFAVDEFDMLFIDINGLDLAEHEDYELALSSGKVIFSTPIPAGQDVHFRALKYQLVDGDKTIKNVMGRKDYNTVAEMKADMNLEAGDICHTLGFYTPGDGGAAWYKIKAHGVANGMDIILLDNGFYAERYIQEKNYDSEIENLQEQIDDIKDDSYSYDGWGGWNVMISNNAFTAGRTINRSITEKHYYDSMPSGMKYSEEFKLYAPIPFNTLNIAGTIDRNCQTIVNANAYNNSGIGFKVLTPYNHNVPIAFKGRLIITGLIRNPRKNPIPTYNSIIGQQIANVAKTYYEAMLNGREFSYGRNFFYVSEQNDVVNDANGKARMECDTFVGMALRGIPYEISPYSVTAPSYTYAYEDLYQDVSAATNWAPSTAYTENDLVLTDDYYYWKCTQAHTSSSVFDDSYWEHVWITNPYGIAWATSENTAMHTGSSIVAYLTHDVLFAGDIAFMGWQQNQVFSDADQALTGDVAIWVRRAKTPTYWGGTSQSPAFDNVAHVGIVYVENGQKYILHVTAPFAFEHTVVNKTPIEDFGVEPPSYFYRPYSN